MKKWLACAGAVWLGMTMVTVVHAADEDTQKHNPIADLQWQRGPTRMELGSRGRIEVPEQKAALSEDESNKFLKLTGNLPTSGLNIIAGNDWWATFEFDESGYVKDDEKIDADALLKQIKESDGPSNEARRKQGLPELYTDGWSVPPHYDPDTKRLEWGLRLHASNDNQPVINYTVRVLGRSGYERVVLVSSPNTLDRDVAEFKQVLAKFDFKDGEKYSEFKQGDRVAQFGLAALVAGGAAAVATKTGFWKPTSTFQKPAVATKTGFWKVLVGFLAAGWKLIAAAVAVGFASLRKLFKRNNAG